ncbi:MAG: hypothetical protein OJF51_001369 [Nitrospira sp.]|nr:MAG: hypothetical protein OJF51_001369 [Nitrospira sp.]
MRAINMPGFTAEASLYRMVRYYQTLGSDDSAEEAVVSPQQLLAANNCYSKCYLDCMDCDRSRPGCPLPSVCASGCRCRCYGICPPPPLPAPPPYFDQCDKNMGWCILGCALGAIFGGNPALCILQCDARYVLCEKYGIG